MAEESLTLEDPAPELVRKQFGLGLFIAAPEVYGLELHGNIDEMISLRVGLAGPTLEFDLPFSNPALYSNNGTFVFETEPIEFDARIVYGPHFSLDMMIFPFAGSFYLMPGLGIRRITAYVDETIDYELCLAAFPNCGGNNPPSARLTGWASSTTTLLRFGTGWYWQFQETMYLNVYGLGVSIPMTHSLDQNLDVDLSDSNLPAWVVGAASSAVNAAVDSQEEQLAESLYDAYAAEYDRLILPIIGLGFGLVL